MRRVAFVCSKGGGEFNMVSAFPYSIVQDRRKSFLRETGKPIIDETFDVVQEWAKEFVDFKEAIRPLCARSLSVKDHYLPENIKEAWLTGYDNIEAGYKDCPWIIYEDHSYR